MISKITIENLKALSKFEHYISNLTIVTGLNSMGKSSFIQSLLLLRQSYEKNVFKSGLLLNGEYTSIGNGKDALSMDAEDEFFRIAIEWEDESELDLQFDYKDNSNLQPIRSITPEAFSFTPSLFNANFQYLAAERVGPKNTYPVSDFDINTLKTKKKNGEFTTHFLAENGTKALAIDQLSHPNSKTNNLLAETDAWMSEISKGIRISASVIPEVNQASLLYSFETNSGEVTDKFRPENVGFGLTYVLPVIVAVLSASPGDLIIVENPEAHLHPAGQSAIARLIALACENGVQIIVESHSDHFINSIRVATKRSLISPENITVFFFSTDINKDHAIGVTEPFLNDDGTFDEWPKGFFDEWEINLNMLIKD